MTEAAMESMGEGPVGDVGSDPAENMDLFTDDVNESEESEQEQALSFDDWKAKQDAESKPDTEPEPEPEPESKPDSEEQEQEEQASIMVKVDGQEREIPGDQVKPLIQKGLAADARMQEAHNMRQEAKDFVEYMKESPWEALERLGLDPDEMAEQRVYEKIRYQQMTPEEKAIHDERKAWEADRKKLQRLEAEREERAKQEQEARERQEAEQRQAQYRAQYQEQIPKALELAKIPRTEENIRSMVLHLKEAVRHNPSATAYDVLDKVRAEHKARLESGRKQRVSEYKQKGPFDEPAPRAARPSQPKAKAKRLTSIYDLME